MKNKFIIKSLVKYCESTSNPIERAMRTLRMEESQVETWKEVLTILKERDKSNVSNNKICKK